MTAPDPRTSPAFAALAAKVGYKTTTQRKDRPPAGIGRPQLLLRGLVSGDVIAARIPLSDRQWLKRFLDAQALFMEPDRAELLRRMSDALDVLPEQDEYRRQIESVPDDE